MYCLVCVVLCIVCVYMCTVLLPPGGYPIAVNKYISYYISNHIVLINPRLSDVLGKGVEKTWRSWIRASWYSYESNQQDATMQVNFLLLFLVGSTCFGRCFRPSSGALDCIYSIW